MPGVNVILKGSDVRIFSDAEGKFSMDIPHAKESDVLEFSFIGYVKLEKKASEINEAPIMLKPDYAALGEVVVVGGVCATRWTPRGIWWRIKNIFR